MKFKEITDNEVKQIDKLQSEYFSKYMHLFDPPLPDGVPERLEKIVESARISGTDVVLDMGTGTGILIPIILKYKPALIYANDLSVKMLKSVKHDYRLNVKIAKYKCLSVKNKFVKYATGMTNFESVQL